MRYDALRGYKCNPRCKCGQYPNHLELDKAYLNNEISLQQYADEVGCTKPKHWSPLEMLSSDLKAALDWEARKADPIAWVHDTGLLRDKAGNICYLDDNQEQILDPKNKRVIINYHRSPWPQLWAQGEGTMNRPLIPFLGCNLAP